MKYIKKEREHFSEGFASAKTYSNEAALSLRSRRNGTKFAAPLLAKLLIKYQRLPRGFFWNRFVPALVCSIDNFTKYNS